MKNKLRLISSIMFIFSFLSPILVIVFFELFLKSYYFNGVDGDGFAFVAYYSALITFFSFLFISFIVFILSFFIRK